MGSGYFISCTECDYNESMLLGQGMAYCYGSLNALPKRTLRKVRALEKIHGEAFLNCLERRAYRCPRCEGIDSRDWFEVQFEDLKIYSGSFRCSKCRVKLEDITRLIDPNISKPMKWPFDFNTPDIKEEKVKPLKKLRCPKCKNPELLIMDGICWD